MAILVCGGAGYVGSHCLEGLRQAGFDCIVVDNLTRGHRAAVGDTPLYVGDISDPAFMDQVFAEHSIEAVLHFAAASQVGESMKDPLLYYENNLCATVALLRAMERHDVKKIVFSSSAAVYGEPEITPIVEDSPKSPTNTYGETKLAMERLMHWCHTAYGLEYVSLRYFNAAGASPGGLIGEDHTPETHLIPLVLQAAQGKRESVSIFGTDYPTPDGTCIRDYIHVVDLAQGHVAAVQYAVRHKGTEIFNLGTGRGSSVLEMVNTFMVATGAQVPYEITGRRAGDIAVCYADPTKSREILGWTAQKTLADMCRDSWNWQSKNPMGYDS